MSHTHLQIFQRNDINKLYQLACKLWRRGAFQYYLNNQQLLVLQQILEDNNDPEGLFFAFMTSGISLKFVEKKKEAEVEAESDSTDKKDPHIKKEDSQQQQQHAAAADDDEINYNESSISNGFEPARQLALKIRYILWDKAIDYYYDNEEDLKEYDLFEQDDEEVKVKDPEQEQPPQSTESKSDSSLIPSNTSSKGRTIDEDDNYDDDDDDDDEEEEEAEENNKPEPEPTEQSQTSIESKTIEHAHDEHGNILLEVPIVDNDEDLRQLDNKILIANFNKIYHNFEHDKETLIKRQKLAENDKLLEDTDDVDGDLIDAHKDGVNGDSMDDSSKKDTLSMNLGAANLSLKHLLRSIEQNKSTLHLTDTELRQLIMDVRKNRSKWASDDKIGQEELYEACEKVVMELRGYTEHSTAFLNKVSKRDAPNYYQIIKKPMDLNTILKKLKSFQYKSKTQFVDDVMLIWKNCLTYNTEPKHFLRTHAIAMQKKSLCLIPLIPDITVKDRSEVEDAFKEEQEESATPAPGGGGKSTSKKGKKRTRNGDVIEVNEKEHEDSQPPSSTSAATASSIDTATVNGLISNNDATETSFTELSSTAADVTMGDATSTEDADEENENEGEGDSNEYLNVEDNDKDDLEMQTWKNLTAKARAEYCIQRSDLFKYPEEEKETWEADEKDKKKREEQGKDADSNLKTKVVDDSKASTNKRLKKGPIMLNIDADALVRDRKHMKEFSKYLGRYQSRKRQTLGTTSEDTKLIQEDFADEEEEDLDEVGKDNKDKDPYLMEYDVASGVPGLAYAGISELDLDAEEQKLVNEVLANGLEPSAFAAVPDKGLNGVINGNIEIMQDIRRLCSKISLIRQMQQQQFVHHTQMKQPQIDAIDDSVDLDPVSRLPNREKLDKKVIFEALRKRVAKVAMQNGFEATEGFAIDTLTQITGDYMNNLIRTIKTHLETPSINKQQKRKNVLRLALLQNGILKPDDLYVYVHENILRQSSKLRDLKTKLSSFLKNLLRPAVQDLNEGAFQDNSEQFLNGDFSNEIGDDFFGFKELGLDKELGLLGNTIPLHLLQSRFAEQADIESNGTSHRESFEFTREPPLSESDISKEIGLFQHFLQEIAQRTKTYNAKQLKSKREMNEYLATAKNVTLLEDEDYPKKNNSKSKLPPNGKIPAVLKKKIANAGYFITENAEVFEAPVPSSAVAAASKVKTESKKSTTKDTTTAVKKEESDDEDDDDSNEDDEDDDELKSEGPSMFSSGGGLSPIVEVNGR